MGMTYAQVLLNGPKDEKKLELLVDTGSLLTWVSEGTLAAIGVRPTGTRKFRTIDGRELIRNIGEAVFEVMGERATTIIVFANPTDAEVLGVVSLEQLGLEVDPTTKELRKTEVFAAYRVS